MDRADVCLLIIDSEAGVTDGDQKVAGFALERGCAVVILLNKWDLVTTEEQREVLEDALYTKLGFVSWAPVLRVSAETGRSVNRVWDAIDTVYENYTQQISTSTLNKFLTELRDFGHTVSKGRKTLRVNYMTQTRTAPPGFTFFANHPTLADDSFRRYVENRMREKFELTGTPVRLHFKQKS